MPRRLPNDCFFTDRDRLTHAEALSLLASRVAPVVGSETVGVWHAAGRILAREVRAPRPIPGHDNSAVDGYAFSHAGNDSAAGAAVRVIGRARAGHPYVGSIGPGQAVRILTGAVMPDGTDTVAMQEDVTRLHPDGTAMRGDTSDDPVGRDVRLPSGLKPGANRRRAGEDVAEGAMVAPAGQRLRPQDLAAVATTGAGEVTCHKPLRVGILSSGDEVLRAGDPYAPGKVYDANAPMLWALAANLGAHVTDLGVIPDDRDAVETRLAEAAAAYDVVLTSGGASQGDEDHMVAALAKLGDRHLWQIAIKPGRPMSFGQIGDCVVLGLPGNPVAVFVCFLLYATPMLLRLSGAPWSTPLAIEATADFEIAAKKTDRREFLRAHLSETDGRIAVRKFRSDGSGLVTSLTASNGLVELAEDVTSVARGDSVRFLPFAGFGWSA